MAVKRLSKVAREMNVGISTIVEFLDSRGIEISTNPNTKIEPAIYEQLLGEFQKSKSVKEKVDEVRSEKEEQKELVAKQKQAEKEAKLEAERQSNSSEEDKEPSTGLKVLGKIDLPSKKSKPEKEEKPAPEAPKETAPKEEKTIKADSDKLKGPSVLGKIDLPSKAKKEKKEVKETPKVEPPKEKAKEEAEKLVAATWDVGHINNIRKSGFEGDVLKEKVIEETKKAFPKWKGFFVS